MSENACLYLFVQKCRLRKKKARYRQQTWNRAHFTFYLEKNQLIPFTAFAKRETFLDALFL